MPSSAVWQGARGIVAPSVGNSHARSRVPRHVRAAFDAFDTNHSGYLDYRELRHALRCASHTL